MRYIRKLAKNIMPYYLAKKYQARNNPVGIPYDYLLANPHNNPLAPGGFYSPIPSLTEVQEYNFDIPLPDNLSGIDLNTNEQMELLNSFEPFYNELPFSDEKTEGLRYFYKNGWYEYSDAICLYCMIRHLTPKKLIEIGSGFSSSVTLDTNETFLGNSINCTFIEPFPERLEAQLSDNDKKRVTIHEKRVQEIPLEVFKDLAENDILFIDTTHVVKFNSDVNYVIHEILPILANGVYIHFHDVFYPFEYKKEWLLKGWFWNEQYMLRAFLQYNNEFKIVLFNSYLECMFEEELKCRFPLLYNVRGASIWLKKVSCNLT